MPRWSPDGRFLAFLSSRGDRIRSHAALAAAARAGGEAGKADRSGGLGVTDYAWSPDGKRLVLVVKDPDPDAVAGQGHRVRHEEATKPIVIDRFQFKEDETGYLGTQRRHLVLLDLRTGRSRRSRPARIDELLPAWSPDGKAIAFSSQARRRPRSQRQLGPVRRRAARGRRAAGRSRPTRAPTVTPDLGQPPGLEPRRPVDRLPPGEPLKLIYYGVAQARASSRRRADAARVLAELDRNVAAPRWCPTAPPSSSCSRTTGRSTWRACRPPAARSSGSSTGPRAW